MLAFSALPKKVKRSSEPSNSLTRMRKGLSLHLGLNYIDPNHYDRWGGDRLAGEADANDMTALARFQGFKPQTLLREEAAAKAVKDAILKAVNKLWCGDTFFSLIPARSSREWRSVRATRSKAAIRPPRKSPTSPGNQSPRVGRKTFRMNSKNLRRFCPEQARLRIVLNPNSDRSHG